MQVCFLLTLPPHAQAQPLCPLSEWLLNDNDGERVKSVLSLLYAVLNMDQLEPCMDEHTPTTPWHGTDSFRMDWTAGVSAALVCLQHLMHHLIVRSSILDFEISLMKLALDLYPPPGEMRERTRPVKIRCVCGHDAHSKLSSVVNWKLDPEFWPKYVVDGI